MVAAFLAKASLYILSVFPSLNDKFCSIHTRARLRVVYLVSLVYRVVFLVPMCDPNMYDIVKYAILERGWDHSFVKNKVIIVISLH